MNHSSSKRLVITLVLLALAALLVAYFAIQGTFHIAPRPSLNLEHAIGNNTSRTNSYDNLQGEISRFFLGVKRSMWPDEEPKKTIIKINLGEQSLADVVNRKLLDTTDPLNKNWRGRRKSRWFMPDDTLKTNAERILAEEHVDLIWWLDKDFIVQAPFQEQGDLLTTLERLARSINSHHAGEVHAYLCPRLRAVLVTSNDHIDSVQQHCTAAQELLK